MLDGCVDWPEDLAASYRRDEYWAGVPLGDLLAATAAARPDRTAVVCGGRRTTFRELDVAADRLAAGLAGRGIGRHDRVVVQLPNVTELVELLFALFRLGAIPVLALPGHRSNEIVHLCRHAEAVAYVTVDRLHRFDHRELARSVGRQAPSVREVFVVCDTDADAEEFTPLARVPVAARPLPPVDPSDVALMLLSGGTTGKPKLIPRTHDDYAFNALACAAALEIDENGVYLAANPVAHNAALGCPGVLGTLLVGGTAVLAASPSPDEAFPHRAGGVTLTTLVPALVTLWMEAARTRPVDLGGMVLQVGSAKFPRDAARAVRGLLGCRLTQWFGVGEGLLTYTRLDDPDDVVLSSEGRPLADADEIRVVDAAGAEVARGDVGELLTRGPYTIRGYYHAETQNRSAFTADGFFRTGDLVRLRPDGNIEVCGRLKEIINRAGDKVSSEEVEDHLAAHPDVREVTVVGLDDPVLGERICAVVVPAPGWTPRAGAVRRFLRERGLAAYKLPDQVELVAALPHTAVGKVDKNAVRAELSLAACA